MEHMEYRGNRFQSETIHSWYRKDSECCISIGKIGSETVWLPECCNGKRVTEWRENPSERRHFDKVKYLYIPASLERVEINNDLFPELERVEVDPSNSAFVSDGRMIIGKRNGELLYCLAGKGACVEIPDSVREIRDNAFYGTRYEKILFSGKETRIASNAFRGSAWLKGQGEMVIIGSMLYRFPDGRKCLTVPGHVRKFHPDLFQGKRNLERLETPVVPGVRDIEALDQYASCHFLTITSPAAPVNLVSLRKWQSLESVTIAADHRKYCTSDGVMYSRDRKTLVWYPPGKRDHTFVIPDGVRKIGEFAFCNQRWLKEVIFPESVTVLGTGAFSECRLLEHVQLSPGIKEIPDSGTYQGAGVFSGCENLHRIVLPEKLNYLGSFAFFGSGLTSVTCNKNLEQMGDYALMAKGVRRITLPPAVRRLGRGSLFYAEEVEAYEGTAKGIVAAVNAVWPYMKNSRVNLEWGRCRITVLHKRSEKRDYFLIPESIRRNAICHLETAWNGDQIDYEEYALCLSEIVDPEEKLEFAEQGLGRSGTDEDSVYTDYVRRISYKMGYRLLEGGKEKEFLSFLKRDFLSEGSLMKLLKYCNGTGRTVCAAYITEWLNRKKGKGRRTGSSLRV